MAMSVALSQPYPAIMGQPCTFIAAVKNTSGGNVNLQGIAAQVNAQNGAIIPGCTIGQPISLPASNTAQVGGFQFNVVIGASSTVNFTFQIVFPAQAVATGTAAQAGTAYVVSVGCFSSDGSVFSIQAPVTQMNLPVFGQPPGVPPNASIAAFGANQLPPGALVFSQLGNTALAL